MENFSRKARRRAAIGRLNDSKRFINTMIGCGLHLEECSEHSDEPVSSIKCGNFLTSRGNTTLLYGDC
jgi:hypothetical protein